MSTLEPPAVDDEQARLDAVQRYDILDTPPDGAFDRITAMAARLCDVPISTITIVDHDRIWFKSAHGVEVHEIDRDPGLCASAVMQLEPYIVTDAAIDPRTLDNPLVRGQLGLRFYAAVPLTTADGHNLGTLNIIDIEPREVTDDDLRNLTDLAAIVVDELELRLAARRTLELEATRQKAAFRDQVIAGLSHEMRTPLAVLEAFTTLTDDDGDPEQRRISTIVRRQLRHLDRLIRQFLDYAGLDSDEPPRLNVGPTDVRALVCEAVEMFADRVDISVDIEEPLPAASADPDRASQVLLELLNNAVRFAGDREPIDVRVTTLDGRIAIEVADRGPGIEPSEIGRVFDRFHRGSRSTGTGIGLYVSRALAEAQGGRIDVTSEPGAGAVFTFVLPAAETAAE